MRRRWWWTPAIVFAAALALRIAIVFQLRGTALFRTPELDSIEYFTWAQRIASGNFTWPAAPPHGPGYPLFLGALLFITRGSMFTVHVLQAIAGSVTAVVIAAIAKRISGERAGLAAGLLSALYGPLALVDVSILAEGLFVLLLSLSLLGVVRVLGPLSVIRDPLSVIRRPSATRGETDNESRKTDNAEDQALRTSAGHTRPILFFAGTALGLAITVRPTAAILVPIFLLTMWRRGMVPLAIFIAATLYPVVPVLAHNWSATGDMLAIQSGGGMNFYIGNSPTHDGTAWARPGGSWDWLRGEPWRMGLRGAAAEDQYYLAKTSREIRSTPGRFVALLMRKAVWLTQNEEIRDSHSFEFFRLRAPLLRATIGFSILLPFAVFGMWVSRRNMPWILVAYLVAMSITVVLLVMGMRYRLPIVPALFVFGGVGAAAIIDKKSSIQFVILFVFVFVFTHMWHHPATHNIAEEWAMEGIALGKEGRPGDAMKAFAQASESDPMLGIAWTGRGDIDFPRKRWDEAEREYTFAMNVDPRNARAYAHLALVRSARGDQASAIELLREAVAIRPEQESLFNLSHLLFASGDLDGAEHVLRDMLALDPTDTEAASGLLHVAEARRARH